ncbi:MAG: hypothetical protein WCS42_06630 [Verrucomicrobiota bacterium]
MTNLMRMRNDLIWRMAPRLMLDHYQCHDDKAVGNGRKDLPKIGIFREFTGLHRQYVAAAEQMGVSFKVVNIMSAGWIDAVRNSGCDLFFVWPSPLGPAWKNMFDERLKIVVEELDKNVYPRLDEIWLWESKRRMNYWLEAKGIRRPQTWVFYDLDEARTFADTASLPLIFKPDFGDCAKGIKVIRTRAQARAWATRGFRAGDRFGGHPGDRSWGCVIFQQFIPNAREWRVIRVGDSLFAYRKGKVGDFHSGSKLVEFDTPPESVLDLMIEVCDRGRFDCMSIDVLEDENGNFYVTELQSLFGGDPWDFQMAIAGVPGRYLVEGGAPRVGRYKFERGVFCENNCANLRIRDGFRKYYNLDTGFWEQPGDLGRCLELAQTKFRYLISSGL